MRLTTPSIEVTNLGKAYRAYPTRWSRLAEWMLPSLGPRHRLHWVLRNISFQVRAGEAVGILGVNGAGKSTLLKLITGTSQASEGAVNLCGRVSALLELGMGFHPEFSGRQNAFMAAQLLGLSADTVTALMPEIEQFAEIGSAIDEPLRVYSSGMQIRLAFSVATAVRPDILIVDEALSVGDSYFQHKSFDRIRSFCRQGTTLLLVSHDKSAVQSMCARAILLSGGHIAMEGAPEAVIDYYNAMIAERGQYRIEQEQAQDGSVQTRSGTGEARILDVAILDRDKKPLEVVAVGQELTLRIRFRTEIALPELVLGYQIKDRLGQIMYGINTALLNESLHNLHPKEIIEYDFHFQAALGEGSYALSIALHGGETHLLRNYVWQDHALFFTVINQTKHRFIGTAWLPPLVECRR